MGIGDILPLLLYPGPSLSVPILATEPLPCYTVGTSKDFEFPYQTSFDIAYEHFVKLQGVTIPMK